MIIWQIVGPLFAVLISIGFTVWHINKLRREDRKAEFEKLFINEVGEWANQILNLCNQIKEYMTNADFNNVLTKRLDLVEVGARLSLVKTFGDGLSDDIYKATSFLSELPDDSKWNENEVKTLREYGNVVKDTISSLKYEK